MMPRGFVNFSKSYTKAKGFPIAELYLRSKFLSSSWESLKTKYLSWTCNTCQGHHQSVLQLQVQYSDSVM